MAGELLPGAARHLSPVISYIGKTCVMVFCFVRSLDGAAPEAWQAFRQSADSVARGMLLARHERLGDSIG